MRSLLCAFLAFTALARADERADRAAIQTVVEALNSARSADDQRAVAALFTEDADNQFARLADLDRRMVRSTEPWSEVTTPRIAVQSIRFITGDVALVDAANAQFGTIILMRRVPLLLVMRRDPKGWRIASLRILVDLMSLP
jgi:ketosteroid isomerase-like protein